VKEKNKIEYPIRINRYLFLKGYCSRRQADRFIEEGLVKINGKKVVLGQKVNEGDKVELAKKVKDAPKNYKYYLFNKPKGVVSHNPQQDEQSVEDIFNVESNVAPVGRLDKASEGLMFLTNDGRIIDKMLNPKFEHKKVYKVWLDKNLKPSFKNKMEGGVDIEGYITKPAHVRTIGPKSFQITLTEGKKHQIRRMCAALGYQVRKLRRVKIIDLKLGSLPTGKGRELKFNEKKDLLESLDLFN
jgi:23S rRNA pseudouridine2604 synthase